MQVISDPYRVSCFLKGLPIKKEALFVASLFTDLPLDSLIDLHIADSSYPSIKYTIRNISSSVNKKQGEPCRYHEVLETADDTYGEFHHLRHTYLSRLLFRNKPVLYVSNQVY